MHAFLARIPLVRLLIPFVAGIACAFVSGSHISFPIFFAGLAIVIALLVAYKFLLRRSLRWSGADGIIITAAIFFTGAAAASFKTQHDSSAGFPRGKEISFMVRLLNEPIVKERSVKLSVISEAYRDSSGWKAAETKMMIYLARGVEAERLQYGDVLLIHAAPAEIDAPKNPDEFDYRGWLARQDIHLQAYAETGVWTRAATGHGNWFKASALGLRRYFLGKLQEYGVNGREGGVAAALLLGASDQLDPGLLQAYSASGTLHVLSVSGMHVALVYVVLLRLLAPLEKRKHGRWLSIAIQLIFLWFYATLTGLCPSVLRSVTMLSVVVAGKAMRRHAHILNSLAASAFILLIINPMLLFDIGFQLSYLAVAGIVILQPMLEQWYEPKMWITRQLWSLVTVTIVAQVFTFPLGLYYFRQFPTYFLLSNLVVIPLSTITMYAGLILLIVSPIAFLAKYIAVVFSFLVSLLNSSVESIEQLPSPVMRSAAWSGTELALLYASIVSFLVYLAARKVRLLQVSLGIFFAMLVLMLFNRDSRFDEQQMVFFRLKNSTAIAVLDNGRHILLTDTTLVAKKGDMDFHVDPFFETHGLYNPNLHVLSNDSVINEPFVHAGKNWIHAGGKKIFIADRSIKKAATKTSCDILLLKDNTSCRLDSLISYLHPEMVVADGSDGKKKTEKWKAICERRKVKFYDVKEGALVLWR